MATPTFVAGACVVVAAILSYGTTQTHLLFSGGLPACASASCTSAGPSGVNGVPDRVSARPAPDGRPGSAAGAAPAPPAGGSAAPGSAPQGSPAPSSDPGSQPAALPPPQEPSTPGGQSAGPRVTVVYRVLSGRHGGFFAAVTISNKVRSVLAGWQLWMRYRSRIERMWGARWFPAAHGTGLAAAPAVQRPLRPGQSVRFIFKASGPGGPPSGCVFDGYRCSFQQPRS